MFVPLDIVAVYSNTYDDKCEKTYCVEGTVGRKVFLKSKLINNK